MNKFVDISLLVVMIGLFCFTFFIMKEEENKTAISTIEVNIVNGDSVRFITKEQIVSALKSDSLKSWSTNYSTCDTYEIERVLSRFNYIDSVESYKSVGGVLNVDIKQENIVLRVITDTGKDLYIDDDLAFLPTVDYFVSDVPILTCDDDFLTFLQQNEKISKKNDKSYYILHNLLNFVRLLESDPFWKSMIVQLNISKSRELQLVPRVGSHTVVLCDLDDIENGSSYLQKLGGFYTKVVATQGWSKYKSINAKYNNIIVATK